MTDEAEVLPYRDKDGTILKVNDRVFDGKSEWKITNYGGVCLMVRKNIKGQIVETKVLRKFDFKKSKKV